MDKTKQLRIRRYTQDSFEEEQDLIVVENHLSIYLNGRHFATLLHLPGNEIQLIAGFLFSNKVIDGINEISSIEFRGEHIAMVTISTDAVSKFAEIAAITSGCGGGKVMLSHINSNIVKRIDSNLCVKASTILDAMKEFNKSSAIFNETGGVHGCAIYDMKKLIIRMEDIGRHNALDKVIGECLKNGIGFHDKLLLSTGRISVDLVTKAAVAGIPIIASHSAPTSHAVELCDALNITLVGFVRGNRMNVYVNPNRLVL